MVGMYFGYQWISDDEGQGFTSKEKSHALTAIPVQSPFVLSIDNIQDFAIKVTEKDNATSAIRNYPVFENVFSLLKSIATLKNGEIASFFTNPIFISNSFISRKESSYIIATNITKNNADKFGTILRSLFPSMSSKHIRTYMGAKMHKANTGSNKSERKDVYYSYTRGLILISDNELMLEASIRQSREEGLFEDSAFERIYSLSNTDKNTTLFINFAHATQYINKLSNTDKDFWHKQLSDNLSFISNYGTWGELKLKLSDKSLALSGLAVSENDGSKLVDAFKNQMPLESSSSEMLADNCACFISLNLSDIANYQNDYRTYLKINSTKFNTYDYTANTVNKKSGVNIKELIYNTFRGNITQSFYINKQANIRPKTVITARLKDQDSYAEWLSFASNYKNDTTYTHSSTDIKSESGNKYKLISSPDTSMISVLLGPLFTKTYIKYFTCYNEHLCFFENINDAKRFISAIETGRTLHNKESFQEVNSEVDEYNILFYLDNTYGLFPTFLNADIASFIQESASGLSTKYRHFTWQMSFDEGVCYNKLCLTYTPKANTEVASEWTKTISSPFSAQPAYVLNHTHPSIKDIVYVDKSNILHYLDKTGTERWTKKLEGKIIDDIQQIDYYANNKWQLMVMTDKSLELIDRLGNSVKGFPRKLASTSASALSVFDYDNKKNYRVFYSTKDGNILLFNKDMQQNKEWYFAGKTHVNQPLQFLRINNKDHLIVLSNDKLHILNRKGATRVKTPNNIKYSNNTPCIVGADIYVTNESGEIIKYKLDGTSEKLKAKDASKNQFFMAFADLNSEIRYVLAKDRTLTILNSKGERIRQDKYNSKINACPKSHSLKDGRKLISFATEDNKVHILDSNGKAINGSPFKGSKYYIADFLDSEVNDMHIITEYKEKEIIMYRIQN